MSRGALEVATPDVSQPSSRRPGATLRIVCPTYWYPQHATDTQATYVHDINRHLVRRGNRVTVVTPGDRSLPSEDRFDGVDVVRFPMELPSDLTYGRVAQGKVSMLGRFARLAVMAHYMEAQYRATVSVAREMDADVVHAHWAIPTGPAAVSAARRLKIPSVITMHGGDVYVNPEQGYDFPTRWYVRPPLRWTLGRADALTAITDDCRQHALRAGAPEAAIRLIFNGTDLRRFSPSPHGNVVDPRFGPQMIFACRQLFPRKGIRFLVEAVAQLKPRFPELKLVLAGDGFERPALVKLAGELGISDDVTFLGWVPNIALPAVLSRRRHLRHPLAGRGLRHPGRGGDGLRGRGGRERRRRPTRGRGARRHRPGRAPRRHRRSRRRDRLAAGRSRAAPADGSRRAASALSDSSTGTGPPSSSNDSISRSGLG